VFFKTVRHGINRSFCGMYPNRPSSLSIGFPSTRTAPVEGSIKPARMLKSVDLPQPEGPTIETNSPALASMSIPSSAWTSWLPAPPRPLKTLEMPSVWSLGVSIC
jgi:hypothetical protein